MYNFCELTKMIETQSSSLIYFFDLMKKCYLYIKNYLKDNAKSYYRYVKAKLIYIYAKIKLVLIEFFKDKNLLDDQLRKQIKILDYIITILLISSLSGLFIIKALK